MGYIYRRNSKTKLELGKYEKTAFWVVRFHLYAATIQSSLSEWQTRIDKHFAYDTVEEIIQSLGLAADAGDEWSLKTKKMIESKSPTSLKVTISQMQRGESQSLISCFNMELALSMNFMKNHDFYEGVRLVLIDKDRNPQWDPKNLVELSSKDVESYFHHPINVSHPIM